MSGYSIIKSTALTRLYLLGGLGLQVAAAAAGLDEAPAGADSTSGAAEIRTFRAAKDSLLRHGPDSPIPVAVRPAFEGLSYYPFDPRFRMVGDLHLYGRRREIQVPTTGDSFSPMERFGRLKVEIEGKAFWLEVYRSFEDDGLLVLFKDATNGGETYAGGRYAPLTAHGEGTYLLDLNMAYNPYCAYNPDYVCPLPPPQNRLPVEIRAGEKKYSARSGSHGADLAPDLAQ